jgi:exosome complex component RRP46
VERLISDVQNLPILPALLQTAILTLLSASMPLSMTLTSVFLALVSKGSSSIVIRNPTLLQSESAKSVHVLAFSSHGDLLVAESEGSFTIDDWELVFEAGKAMCCDGAEDQTMQDQSLDNGSGSIDMFVKSALQAKVTADLHWKG